MQELTILLLLILGYFIYINIIKKSIYLESVSSTVNHKSFLVRKLEDKQEAAQKFQSLQQDINFLREKTNQFRNQTLQLISQEQAEKFQVIVTELIRAKGITLLINSGSQQGTLLHADQSFDITQEVIDAMNEKED